MVKPYLDLQWQYVSVLGLLRLPGLPIAHYHLLTGLGSEVVAVCLFADLQSSTPNTSLRRYRSQYYRSFNLLLLTDQAYNLTTSSIAMLENFTVNNAQIHRTTLMNTVVAWTIG